MMQTEPFAFSADSIELPFFQRALKGTDEEKNALSALFFKALETPTGREMLKCALNAGYSFSFDEGMTQSGACDSEAKSIILNSGRAVGIQLSTLVHESRHALQAERSPKYPALFRTADQIKYRRAIEADAYACECAFVSEITPLYPEVREEALKHGMPVLKTYEKTLEGTGDSFTAMSEAFKAWYDYPPYQKAYDRWHKEDIVMIAEHGLKNDYNGYFMTHFSSADVAKVCSFRGREYIDPAFLETPRAFSVSDADKEEILAVTRRYALLVGRLSCDGSVEKMFSREDPTGEKKRVEERAEALALREKESSKEKSPDMSEPVQNKTEPEKKADFWQKIRAKMTRFGGR